MGGAPYKLANEGGGLLFRVLPHLTMKECTCNTYSDSMPSDSLKCWANNNNRASSLGRSSPDDMQHLEQLCECGIASEGRCMGCVLRKASL